MTPVEFPLWSQRLFEPARYKVAHGGRGSGKSWQFARALIVEAARKPTRVLCARETQKSIQESVHRLLADQIAAMGLDGYFQVQESRIFAPNGSEFVFAGVRQQGVQGIKSFEGVDICWVEEAQVVTDRSWEILIPTIRKPGSEIWITLNPDLEDDPTYKRFIANPPDDSIVMRVNWNDNPWFPETLRAEMEQLKARDYRAYENVWLGECRTLAEGAILGKELDKAETDGRIGSFAYDPNHPVFVAFDIGVADPTCVWYGQKIGGRWRFIDYDQGTDDGLPYWARLWKAKPYDIRGYFCPHDGKQREWGTGLTPKMQAANFGIMFEDVPSLSVDDRIYSARAFVANCEFDREKCAEGLRGIRSWKWDFNARLNERKNKPLHDWASHPGDAFSYFAISVEEMERKVRPKPNVEALYNYGTAF